MGSSIWLTSLLFPTRQSCMGTPPRMKTIVFRRDAEEKRQEKPEMVESKKNDGKKRNSAWSTDSLECMESHHPSSLTSSSEGTEEVALHRARWFPWCAGGRNHSETCVGCMVSWTTATNWSLNCSRSTSLRSVALKAASTRAASYLRR